MGTKVKVAALAAAMGVGGVADAAVITQRIDLNTALTNGGTFEGLFDITGLMPVGFGSTFDVTSATITAYAFSDSLTSQTSQSSGYYQTGGYTYYSPGGSSCYYSFWSGRDCYYYASYYVDSRQYRRDVDISVTDSIVDAMQVTVGADSAVDTVETVTSSTDYGADIYENGSYYSGWYSYVNTAQYRRERTNSSIAAGDIFAMFDLSALSLADLEQDMKINFSLHQLVGAANAQWIELSANVEDIADETPVPEPGTIGLLGAGLVTAAALRRRRRR